MPHTDPPHSNAYGHAENADDTRQAQQAFANDTPTDVNINAMFARWQGQTIARSGDAAQANQDFRDKVAGAYMAKLMGAAAG